MTMTKKETAIFMKFYNEGLSTYMEYAMKHEAAPLDILERAVVLSELRKALIDNHDMTEAGA